MTTLRTAVIGAGHMGSLHATRLAACSGARLMALADIDTTRAKAVAQPLGCEVVSDFRDLLGSIDAACVAVPTNLHHEIAAACMDAGVHVLVEKPLARTLDEADRLLDIARDRGIVLQVGHLQRYNPAFVALAAREGYPLFIDIERLAPFKPRSTDIDVVLDLMIHDLDLLLALARAPVEHVSASGFPVVTDGIDIANARIEFADGSVANLSASRVSQATLRKFRVFWSDAYISADLQQQRLRVVSRGPAGMKEADEVFPRTDEIQAQAEAFVRAANGAAPPPVTGAQGRQALALALEIRNKVRERLARHGHAH
jgi:predicted dehydrogenase